VDKTFRRLGKTDPVRPRGRTDITVDEMESTVAEFYEEAMSEQPSPGELLLDADLQDIFKAGRKRKTGVRPAVELLRENHKSLVDKLTYWSGVPRSLIKKLMEAIETRVGEMDLRADVKLEKDYLTEITVYATALAMNYVTRGKFVQT
jgi:pimeloyl-CoA synthetase